MESKISSTQQVKLLDEIIDNAAGLPVESQDLLLMMAKAMKYTRDSMERTGQSERMSWGESIRG